MSHSRNHQLSQHFLRSPRLALMLIGHSNIKKRDLVLDIGAGSGVITAALAKRCREVWAIEPDPVAIQKLRQHLAASSNVSIKPVDFFTLTLPTSPYKVFANPPFHLSSAILRKLITASNPPDSIYLILQKQLALKLIQTERHYTSQLGQQINRLYTTKIRYPLKPTDFTPPPAVPTVLYEARLTPSSYNPTSNATSNTSPSPRIVTSL